MVAFPQLNPRWSGEDVDRFRLLASAMAGRGVDVEPARDGEAGYTDGRAVYVEPGTDQAVVSLLAVQCSLLACGSLTPEVCKVLTGRPGLARRYLAVEGWRALAAMAPQVPPFPLVMQATAMEALTSSPEESLALAQSRRPVPEAPPVFGIIRPGRLRATAASDVLAAGAPTPKDLNELAPEDALPEVDEDEETESLSGLSKLLSNGLQTSLSLWLTKKLGGRGQPDDGEGGSDLPMGGSRAVTQVGKNAQVCLFPPSLSPVATETSFGRGWLYPEWDVHADTYRFGWCTVTEFDPPKRQVGAVAPPASGDLRRRLARLAVALERRRREAQGDGIDIDAVVEARVDLAAGSSPSDRLYIETQRKKRSLSVLFLVDASGSSGEQTGKGDVLRHQREASALLLDALSSLGDRVALFGFRSRGRNAVSFERVKDFDDRLDGATYERLGALRATGYTRLGAAIRHGTHTLETRAGTERRLLVVLSDGFPYDDGYEGRYGEEDARQALTEARRRGVGCLCLSLGATNEPEALRRVFGTAAHAHAKEFDDLIPDIGRLFRRALASADLQRRLAQRDRGSELTEPTGAR